MFFDDPLSGHEKWEEGLTPHRLHESQPEVFQFPSSSHRGDWIHELALRTETERQAPDILPYPTAFMEEVFVALASAEESILRRSQAEKEEAMSATNPLHPLLLPFRPSDLMALEAQRARFFVTEFHRCRLHKIEMLSMTLYYEGMVERQSERRRAARQQQRSDAGSASVKSESQEEELELAEVDDGERTLVPPPFPQREHLSPNEAAVADRLALSLEKAIQQAGLHLVPPSLQRLIPQPLEAEDMEILPQPQMSTYVFCKALEDLGGVTLSEGVVQTIHKGDLLLVPYRTFRPYVLSGMAQLL